MISPPPRPDPDGWRRVDDPDAADALLREESFRFLRPFLTRERTLGEAARELGASVALLHYHARRLAALGLLEVARETPRRGRPLKHYRAVSSRFYVPFAATRLDSLETLMALAEEGEQRRFVRDFVRAGLRAAPHAERGGTLVHVMPGGMVSVDFTPDPPPDARTPPEFGAGLWSSWTTLHLTPAEAADLERELAALWRAKVERHGVAAPGRRPFTLRLGLVPDGPGR